MTGFENYRTPRWILARTSFTTAAIGRQTRILTLIAASIIAIATVSINQAAAMTCSGTWNSTAIVDGSVADATPVMGNFSYLYNCLTLFPGIWTSTNIGIGTTVPNAPLSLGNPMADVYPRTYNNNDQGNIAFYQAQDFPGTNNYQRILDIMAGGLNAGGNIRFLTQPANSSAVSAMLINSAGYVGIGTTGPWEPLTVQSTGGEIALNGTGGNATGGILFYDNGTVLWNLFGWHADGNFYLQNSSDSINMRVVTGTNSWAATSDIRLKANIRTLSILERLDGYRAVSFDWKQTGKHDIGVVAQELYRVFPEVVNRGSDGALSGPNDKGAWSVQYDRLGALALEAAKELKAQNDDANRKIAVLTKAMQDQKMEIQRLNSTNTAYAEKISRMQAEFERRLEALEQRGQIRTAQAMQ